MSRPSIVVLGLSLLLVPACSRKASVVTAPDGAATPGMASAVSPVERENGDFYPLAVGNVWKYQRQDHAELRTLTGTVIYRMDVDGEQTRTIECTNPFEGGDWFIEIQRFRATDGTVDILTSSYRLRQDRDGLYSASARSYDLCRSETRAEAARADVNAGRRGVLPGSITDPRSRAILERSLRFRDPLNPTRAAVDTSYVYRSTMLRYPLHVGARWVWSADASGSTIATVEAHEVLGLPAGKFPAWRVRLRRTDMLPGESFVVWFGRAGLVAQHYHAEYPVFDDDGVVTGSALEDGRQSLIGFEPLGTSASAAKSD